MMELSKKQASELAEALSDYRKSLPTPDNDGATKLAQLSKEEDSLVANSISQSEPQISSNKVDDSTPLTTKSFIQKNKTNLLIIVALVAGYFAYKKFKK